MDDCTCLYGGFDDYDEQGFQTRITRRARKEYQCVECREPIRKGDSYVHFASKFEGRIFTNRTCVLCEEIREALYCDGYFFGRLWADVRDQIFDRTGLTVACVDKLTTVEAKKRLQQAWMGYLKLKDRSE